MMGHLDNGMEEFLTSDDDENSKDYERHHVSKA